MFYLGQVMFGNSSPIHDKALSHAPHHVNEMETDLCVPPCVL